MSRNDTKEVKQAVKDKAALKHTYDEAQTAIAIAGMVDDLLKQVPADSAVVVATNLLAHAYSKAYNGKVPLNGSDFTVGSLIVSIYPNLTEEQRKRYEGAILNQEIDEELAEMEEDNEPVENDCAG